MVKNIKENLVFVPMEKYGETAKLVLDKSGEKIVPESIPVRDLTKTVVTYANGDIIGYDIVGTLKGAGNILSMKPTTQINDVKNAIRIEIGTSVTNISTGAFCKCTSLTSITIPDSVTNIDITVFQGCTGFPVIDGLRYADSYLIEVVDKTITTANIKEGTRWISYSLFKGCSSLTNVTIPDSVISIGDAAFEGCTGFPVINGLRYADSYLIEVVDKTITTANIKEGTKWIGNSAFDGCTGLTSITIPDSVISIGTSAFFGCTGLTTIIIPDSVTSIGGGVFQKCTGLTSINIPNSVTIIGMQAFYNCTGLTSVVIPDSVTSISNQAFLGCTSLTEIHYNGSATGFPWGATNATLITD